MQAIGVGGVGGELEFEAPRVWRPDFTAPLEAAARLQTVTMPSLLSRGARDFCWVNAGEGITVRCPLVHSRITETHARLRNAAVSGRFQAAFKTCPLCRRLARPGQRAGPRARRAHSCTEWRTARRHTSHSGAPKSLRRRRRRRLAWDCILRCVLYLAFFLWQRTFILRHRSAIGSRRAFVSSTLRVCPCLHRMPRPSHIRTVRRHQEQVKNKHQVAVLHGRRNEHTCTKESHFQSTIWRIQRGKLD